MKFIIIISLLFYSLMFPLNAKVLGDVSIDNSKKIIQIGMFKDKNNINDCIQKYNKHYTLAKKSYKDLEIIYAVNIKADDLKKVFSDIKELYVDAFINNKVSFASTKKSKQSKKPKKNMMATIDDRIDLIQIGKFKQEKNLLDSIVRFGKQNDMMITRDKNRYVSYIMNTNKTQTKKDLTMVKKSYCDAFLNTKLNLYSKPQKSFVQKPIIKEKVIEKIVEKVVQVEKIVEVEKIVYVDKIIEKVVYKTPKKLMNTEPIDLERLIISFENLPYAMYGRK